MKLIFKILVICLSMLFVANSSFALSISASNFGGNEFIEDFDAAVPLATISGGIYVKDNPLFLSGVTYTASSQLLRIFTGSHVFTFGSAIGTNTSSGYIDVVFDIPVLRAGGWIGASGAKSEFYAANNYLLGSLSSSHLSPDEVPIFLGWETESYLIERIRFTDLEPSDRTVLVLDRLTSELGLPPVSGIPPEQASPVPEPSTLLLLGAGLAGFAAYRRKAKK